MQHNYSQVEVHKNTIFIIITFYLYFNLVRFLYLNDNSKMPSRESKEFDKLFKIHPLILHFKVTFQSLYKPARHLSVDENMVPFKGRSTMKQFMTL